MNFSISKEKSKKPTLNLFKLVYDEEFVSLINSLSAKIKSIYKSLTNNIKNLYNSILIIDEQGLYVKCLINEIQVKQNEKIKQLIERIDIIKNSQKAIEQNLLLFDTNLNNFFNEAKLIFKKMKILRNQKINKVVSITNNRNRNCNLSLKYYNNSDNIFDNYKNSVNCSSKSIQSMKNNECSNFYRFNKKCCSCDNLLFRNYEKNNLKLNITKNNNSINNSKKSINSEIIKKINITRNKINYQNNNFTNLELSYKVIEFLNSLSAMFNKYTNEKFESLKNNLFELSYRIIEENKNKNKKNNIIINNINNNNNNENSPNIKREKEYNNLIGKINTLSKTTTLLEKENKNLKILNNNNKKELISRGLLITEQDSNLSKLKNEIILLQKKYENDIHENNENKLLKKEIDKIKMSYTKTIKNKDSIIIKLNNKIKELLNSLKHLNNLKELINEKDIIIDELKKNQNSLNNNKKIKYDNSELIITNKCIEINFIANNDKIKIDDIIEDKEYIKVLQKDIEKLNNEITQIKNDTGIEIKSLNEKNEKLIKDNKEFSNENEKLIKEHDELQSKLEEYQNLINKQREENKNNENEKNELQKFSIMGDHFANNYNDLEGFKLNKDNTNNNNINSNSDSIQSEIDIEELIIEMEANKKQLDYIKQLYKESEKKLGLIKEICINIVNKYSSNKNDKVINEDITKLKKLFDLSK